MAELDFAFLAEYARTEPSGMMSILGVNMTHLYVPEFPVSVLINVIGRAWLAPDEKTATAHVEVKGPEDAYEITIDRMVQPSPSEPLLEGRRAAMFAIPVVVPLVSQGLYVCHLTVDDSPPVRMSFMSEVGAVRMVTS